MTERRAAVTTPPIRTRTVANLDGAAVTLAARHRRGSLDAVAKLASAGGRGGLGWAAVVTVVAARTRGLKAVPTAGATVLAAFVASAGLARVVCRERPFVKSGTQPVIPPPSGPSCPSDHAASSVAAAYLLSRLLPRHRPEAWTAAFLVCASRVYAGVHYPSDVLAGAALGGAAGGLWAHVADAPRRRRGASRPDGHR